MKRFLWNDTEGRWEVWQAGESTLTRPRRAMTNIAVMSLLRT